VRVRWWQVAVVLALVAVVAVVHWDEWWEWWRSWAIAGVGVWAMNLSGVPLLRLLAVVVTSVAAVALGVLVVRLRSKRRRARRVAVVVLVVIALAFGLLVPSLPRPAIEGQEVVVGQRFAYFPDLDVAIRSVECGEYCLVEVTGTNTGEDTYFRDGCGIRFEPFVSLVGRRGTVYSPEAEDRLCTDEIVDFPFGASDTDGVAIDVTVKGLLDLLDVRGSDEVVAVVFGSARAVAATDRYSLIGPHNDRPGWWAAAAAGLLKLSLLAAAGAVGAAVLEIRPLMVKRFKINRSAPLSDLSAGTDDAETARRALTGLIRGGRSGRSDTSE